jgi:hypothetical protein
MRRGKQQGQRCVYLYPGGVLADLGLKPNRQKITKKKVKMGGNVSTMGHNKQLQKYMN